MPIWFKAAVAVYTRIVHIIVTAVLGDTEHPPAVSTASDNFYMEPLLELSK